jgi:hypothetical protein
MASGFRSLVAYWLGGASSPPAPASTEGIRSLLAFWLGGASSAAAIAATGGFRSPMAFWIGGASSSGIAPPVVEGPGDIFGERVLTHLVHSQAVTRIMG